MSCIEYKVDADAIVTLTLDMQGREANVFNQELSTALADVLEKLEADESLRGVILTSGKSTFLAGGDLALIERLAAGDVRATFVEDSAVVTRLLRRLETLGKPVVAAINGTALGAGYEICLACHYRISTDSAKCRIGLPETGLGLIPGMGGTQRLPRLIGIQGALGVILQGKQLAPDKALQAGLIDKVVSSDHLLLAAKEWLMNSPNHVQPWDRKDFEVPGGSIESPAGAQILMGSNAMLHAKTFGNFPHSKAVLSCFWEGLRLPLDRATIIESRYLYELLKGSTTRNMIRTLFFGVQSANKLERRPEGIEKYDVKKIGVLGAGLMGGGVAYVAANVGVDVVLIDRDQESANKGKQYAEKLLDKGIARKKVTPEKKERVLSRIVASANYGDLAGCDVVVEAVFEDRDVKATVTAQAEAVIDAGTIFGTNTSTLPITGLAQASKRPENFIGVHFFSPVDRMPLVEVIRGKQTSDETLAKTLDFVQRIGKTPIVVNDSRGFYTSRVFGTYITEGIGMLADGVNPALIENAGKMSGMPMPPLGLADEVGLSLMHSVGKQTKKDLGNAYKPNPSTPVLELLVEQEDRIGRKTGKGFYDHPDGAKKRLWPGLRQHFAEAEEQPTVDEVIQRYLYAQALETARCVEEGVITSVVDADVGAVMGWGFAAHTGGPLSYIDAIGLRTFVMESDRLARKYGERFEPPALLREMAERNENFHS